MAFTYPPFEEYGNKLIRWIENDNEPGCPIPISTLNSWNLPQPMDWHIEYSSEWLSPEHIASIVGLGLPVGDFIQDPLDPTTESPCVRHSIIKTQNGITALVGTTGPGVFFVYSIRRYHESNDPYISQLTKIAYEAYFPLDTLKYIFMNDVIEPETEPFIEGQIYPSREGLSYPSAEPQTWDYPSPEFTAIMGTPIGKVVGSFILDIRFDIEDI
ncbi:unnamed protein product [Penicillium glandicola]